MFGFKKEIRLQSEGFCNAMKAMQNHYDKKIDSLEDEIWKLNNPPKFKIGNKVRGLLVVDVSFNKGTENNTNKLFYAPHTWVYVCFNSKENKTETLLENELTHKTKTK